MHNINLVHGIQTNMEQYIYRTEQLIAFAISQYEKTRFFNRRGCDYTRDMRE